jgi:hypothetical protein
MTTVKSNGITCRLPEFAEVDRFMAQVEKNKLTASRALVLACLKAPSLDEAKAIIDAKPLVVVALAGKLCELAGGDSEIEVEGN